MEDLNKTQIVLLCLLMSFVTSIGTGIITASLLQEVPQNITQTINRVVERTVETIVPQIQTPGVVTREVTVVVKEEDLVIDAIKKNRNSLVWVVENQTPAEAARRPAGRSVGVVLKKDGTILADRRFVTRNNSYHITLFADGITTYPVTLSDAPDGQSGQSSPSQNGQSQNSQQNVQNNVVFLSPTIPDTIPRSFTPAVFGNSDSILLGQTVIAMGGKEKDSVAIGRINSVNHIAPPNEVTPAATSTSQATTTRMTASLETDTPLRDMIAGSVLINLKGEVVGFENFDIPSGRESLYTAINILKLGNAAFFESAAN